MNWHRPRPFAVPSGAHHSTGLPLDRIPTRPLGTVRVIPDPDVPTLSAEVLAPLPKREPGTNWPPPGADPAPVVTEVWFHRDLLEGDEGLRADYTRLPLFRQAVGDKFMLHQLAMRAPSATFRGYSMTGMPASITPFRDQAESTAEGIVEEAWDALDAWCADCRAAVTGFCDTHTELQARIDEVRPVLHRLYEASTDDEARVIVADLPSLAAALTGTGIAA